MAITYSYLRNYWHSSDVDNCKVIVRVPGILKDKYYYVDEVYAELSIDGKYDGNNQTKYNPFLVLKGTTELHDKED
jgi:hypothetical protein